ncbi:hypothetical protein HYH02_000508 [Chlamydomonas schloesseri]|uniref:Uncharacterized protein n=1 Tax=Chlamydomonas schloesseri TaxID=2026947 RepID=A0A835WWE0_9CHLO|nr:hypothetical protein HYH02_000508 [Chlamydomonas schloesseri]|eukprot:KAG2454669.1 hypothetical protein HYH02_000508 [Chlamydomonas schloesseri]
MRLRVRGPPFVSLLRVAAEQRSEVLRGVAHGCPLPVLQQYYEQWVGAEDGAASDEQNEGSELGAALAAAAAKAKRQQQELLLRAATSPTSDWAAKHLTAAHGLELPAEAVEAAGTAGDVDAASFCLGLPPVLSMVPGPAGQDGWHAPAEVLALAAASAGQVAVLRLLKERGVTLGWAHVQAAMQVKMEVKNRGAEVDVEAVARGGSEEQLGWALAVRRTRRTSKARAAKVVEAADCLKRRNLGLEYQHQLQGLVCSLAAGHGSPEHIPALAWLLDNYQMVWTRECLGAVDELMAIAGDGGWLISIGQACSWRRMVQAARVALSLEEASSESGSEEEAEDEEAEDAMEGEVDESGDEDATDGGGEQVSENDD